MADSVNSDVNDSHTNLKCATCHAMQEKITVKREKCLTCHNTDLTDPLYTSFHKSNNDNCLRCHSFHNREIITAIKDEFSFNYQDAGSKYQCQACHNSNTNLLELSEGHKEATKVYHSDDYITRNMSPSESCLVCHSNNAQTEKLHLTSNTIEFNEHASHPYNVNLDSKMMKKLKSVDDNKLFNNKIECQTCHLLTVKPSEDMTIKNDYDYDNCLNCHGGNVGYANL